MVLSGKTGIVCYLNRRSDLFLCQYAGCFGTKCSRWRIHIQDGKTYATYWKNGNPQLLTSGDNFAQVESLAIAGNTVYAAGREHGNDVGKYWKDGQVVNLTDGSSQVIISAVYTKGHDVYVAGRRRNGDSWELVVWKNNNIIFTTPAPMNAFDIQIHAVSELQNTVLVTGSVIFRNE